MYRHILTIFIFFTLLSCVASKKSVEQKIAPQLLQKITAIEDSGLDEFINFTGICEVDLSYEMRNEIEYTGARIDKYSKNIFSAVGTTEQIRKAAQLSFIKQIKYREE